MQDPRVERLPCTHKGTYADDCICERVKQHKCYIVATCDKDLRRRIRKVWLEQGTTYLLLCAVSTAACLTVQRYIMCEAGLHVRPWCVMQCLPLLEGCKQPAEQGFSMQPW